VYWNPAGLAFAPGIEVMDQGFAIDDIDWIGDTHLYFDGALVSLGSVVDRVDLGTLCVWRTHFEMGPLAESEYDLECGDEDLGVGLAYAHRLGPHVAVGVGYKWVQEQFLCAATGSGNGLDIGLALREHLNVAEDAEIELRAAGGVRNLGSYRYRDGDSNDLPRESYIGFAPTFRAVHLWDWLFEITLSGEMAFDDVYESRENMFGVEAVFLDGLALRMGTNSWDHGDQWDSRGLGIAARYGNTVGFAFDYSHTNLEFLGAVERYMLTLRFLNCTRGLNLKTLLNRG
jgi:hypothetical protein